MARPRRKQFRLLPTIPREPGADDRSPCGDREYDSIASFQAYLENSAEITVARCRQDGGGRDFNCRPAADQVGSL